MDRVLDNDASLMLTTVWKRGKPAKMAVRAQENRACGAKKRRASRATRGLKRRPCGRPHTPVGESSLRGFVEVLWDLIEVLYLWEVLVTLQTTVITVHTFSVCLKQTGRSEGVKA